jgi:hypothetical protein
MARTTRSPFLFPSSKLFLSPQLKKQEERGEEKVGELLLGVRLRVASQRMKLSGGWE